MISLLLTLSKCVSCLSIFTVGWKMLLRIELCLAFWKKALEKSCRKLDANNRH